MEHESDEGYRQFWQFLHDTWQRMYLCQYLCKRYAFLDKGSDFLIVVISIGAAARWFALEDSNNVWPALVILMQMLSFAKMFFLPWQRRAVLFERLASRLSRFANQVENEWYHVRREPMDSKIHDRLVRLKNDYQQLEECYVSAGDVPDARFLNSLASRKAKQQVKKNGGM